MVKVKILAISNVDGCTDRIVEVFENTDASIVAKEETGGVKAMCDRVSEAMNKGIYEYAIVATDDHVGATVNLNKYDKLKAAVCDSDYDIELALKNDVNVIIIRSDQRKLNYLADGIAKEPERQEKKEKLEKVEKVEVKHKEEKHESKEEKVEESHSHKGGGKGGIFGRVKDSLGIMD